MSHQVGALKVWHFKSPKVNPKPPVSTHHPCNPCLLFWPWNSPARHESSDPMIISAIKQRPGGIFRITWLNRRFTTLWFPSKWPDGTSPFSPPRFPLGTRKRASNRAQCGRGTHWDETPWCSCRPLLLVPSSANGTPMVAGFKDYLYRFGETHHPILGPDHALKGGTWWVPPVISCFLNISHYSSG